MYAVQVCCKEIGCSVDGADWSPAVIMSYNSLQSAVRLNISDCSDPTHLTGLRYGWRESPFQYLRAAVYSKENDLPAPPFVFLRKASWMHTGQNFVYKIQ